MTAPTVRDPVPPWPGASVGGATHRRVADATRRFLAALLERELASRGCFALLGGSALLVAGATAAQARVQHDPLMDAQLWHSLPMGPHPAITLAGWLGALVALRTATTRIEEDRESGWIGVLHAEGVPAVAYALAMWLVAGLVGLLAVVAAHAAVHVVAVVAPAPAWAPRPGVRPFAGGVALAADFAAIGVLAATFLRGAVRATTVALAAIGAPFVLLTLSVLRGIELPTVVARSLTAHVPPLSQHGRWAILGVQLAHAGLVLAFALAASRRHLVRRP